MHFAANYEIRSECSVLDDGLVLRIQHPRGLYRARIENIPRDTFDTPFLLSLHLYFDASDLEASKEVSEELLAECLNMLAFSTSCRFKRHRIRQIVDATPGSGGMRSLLMWGDAIQYEDPQPYLSAETTRGIERLLEFDCPPAIKRALRWYRLGVNETQPDDQFMCFWFALEIVAEHQKSIEKVNDRCPKCHAPLFCESCKTHPMHKPYAKQAIAALLKAADPKCEDATIALLDKTRNSLMHGATLKEIEADLPSPHESVVDVLGRMLWKALIHQFPREMFDGSVVLGHPSTYIHYSVNAIAHIQTVVPEKNDGDFDLSFSGTTMKMQADGPPQSARPTLISMSPEQHKRLVQLSYMKGDQQEMLGRVGGRAQQRGQEVIVSVPSTDMKTIRESLRRGESGAWQDIFLELVQP
ncbi:MAG: methylamine utilization protein MauJ [Pseudomonadota bacterium]